MKGKACSAKSSQRNCAKSSSRNFEAIRIMNRAIALVVKKLNENQLFIPFKAGEQGKRRKIPCTSHKLSAASIEISIKM